MTEKQFNRTRFADIMSFEAFQKLAKAIEDKPTSLPEYAKIPVSKYFGTSKKTGLLTASVMFYVKHSLGWYATRTNSTGIPRKNPKTGKVIWTPGYNKGMADITAVGPGGMSIFIEIKAKATLDRMRPDQEKFRDNVIKMGAQYWIVSTFDDLLTKIDELQRSTFKFSSIQGAENRTITPFTHHRTHNKEEAEKTAGERYNNIG